MAFIILNQAIRKIVWNLLILLHSTMHIFFRLLHSAIHIFFPSILPRLRPFVHNSFLSFTYQFIHNFSTRIVVHPSIHYSSPIHSSFRSLMEPTIKPYSLRRYILYDSYWFYKAVFQLICRTTKSSKINKSYHIKLCYLESTKSISHIQGVTGGTDVTSGGCSLC